MGYFFNFNFIRRHLTKSDVLEIIKMTTELWDHASSGNPILLHMAYYCDPSFSIDARILREIADRCQNSTVNASVQFTDGISIIADRFTDVTRNATGHRIDIPLISNIDVSTWVNVLQAKLSSSEMNFPFNLAMTIRENSLQIFLLTTTDTFRAVPLHNVVLAKTALSKNLSTSLPPSHPKMGFISRSKTGRLLLMVDCDPKVATLPMVGVWVSGVSHACHSFVWISCLRYLNSPVIQHISKEPFLCVVYVNNKPLFYDVYLEKCKSALMLFSGDHPATLPLDKQSDRLTIDLREVVAGPMFQNISQCSGGLVNHPCDNIGDAKQKPDNFSLDVEKLLPEPLGKLNLKSADSTEVTIYSTSDDSRLQSFLENEEATGNELVPDPSSVPSDTLLNKAHLSRSLVDTTLSSVEQCRAEPVSPGPNVPCVTPVPSNSIPLTTPTPQSSQSQIVEPTSPALSGASITDSPMPSNGIDFTLPSLPNITAPKLMGQGTLLSQVDAVVPVPLNVLLNYALMEKEFLALKAKVEQTDSIPASNDDIHVDAAALATAVSTESVAVNTHLPLASDCAVQFEGHMCDLTDRCTQTDPETNLKRHKTKKRIKQHPKKMDNEIALAKPIVDLPNETDSSSMNSVLLPHLNYVSLMLGDESNRTFNECAMKYLDDDVLCKVATSTARAGGEMSVLKDVLNVNERIDVKQKFSFYTNKYLEKYNLNTGPQDGSTSSSEEYLSSDDDVSSVGSKENVVRPDDRLLLEPILKQHVEKKQGSPKTVSFIDGSSPGSPKIFKSAKRMLYRDTKEPDPIGNILNMKKIKAQPKLIGMGNRTEI